MEKKVFSILLGGTILTGVLAFLIISFVTRPLDDEANNIKQQVFNQDLWLQYSGSLDRDNPRGAMAVDLKRVLLEKKYSKNEILEMLGPPEMDKRDDHLSYHLGMWSDNRRSTDSFDIYFDENKTIKRINLGQH